MTHFPSACQTSPVTIQNYCIVTLFFPAKLPLLSRYNGCIVTLLPRLPLLLSRYTCCIVTHSTAYCTPKDAVSQYNGVTQLDSSPTNPAAPFFFLFFFFRFSRTFFYLFLFHFFPATGKSPKIHIHIFFSSFSSAPNKLIKIYFLYFSSVLPTVKTEIFFPLIFFFISTSSLPCYSIEAVACTLLSIHSKIYELNFNFFFII